MTEIELLTEQIIALEPLIDDFKISTGILFLGLVGGLISGFIIIMTYSWSSNYGMIGVGAILLTLGVISGVTLFTSVELDSTPLSQQKELEKQRSDLIKTQIKALDCEGLRLDILNKLEDDNIEWYLKEHDEFEKTYYYHKCEIPLREEVIRLGKNE